MAKNDNLPTGNYKYHTGKDGKSVNFNTPKAAPKKAAPAAKKPAPKPSPKIDPAGGKPFTQPKRPITPTPSDKGKFNPLTSTTLLTSGKVVPGPVAPKKKGERFNPVTSTYYKNGGKIDGSASKGKTKGRYC